MGELAVAGDSSPRDETRTLFAMGKLLTQIKQIFRGRSGQTGAPGGKRGRNSQIVGHASAKEIENASPERAGELAGHAVERVET